MSKFTLGPWEAIGTSVYFRGKERGGFDIYKCPNAEGTARLISAAPDMYKALKQCQKLFGNTLADDRPSTASVVSIVEQALAKADGK